MAHLERAPKKDARASSDPYASYDGNGSDRVERDPLVGGETPIDAAISSFRKNTDDEGYLLAVDVKAYRGQVAATFAVIEIGSETRVSRGVIMGAERLPVEVLSAKASALLLERLRSFDWSAQPKKEDPQIGCVFGSPTRITLQARVHGTFREISGDASRIPALADLIALIVQSAEEANQATQPMPLKRHG